MPLDQPLWMKLHTQQKRHHLRMLWLQLHRLDNPILATPGRHEQCRWLQYALMMRAIHSENTRLTDFEQD